MRKFRPGIYAHIAAQVSFLAVATVITKRRAVRVRGLSDCVVLVRVLVLGGTEFVGRHVVERLHSRGDDVLVVHRGHHEPQPWIDVEHLHADRHSLEHRASVMYDFCADAIVDTYAMTGADVTAVMPLLPDVPSVVLSSQDVYQAFTGLRTGRCLAAVPLTENAELRHDKYPYRGCGLDGVPDDYEKRDVEDLWLARGATVLRLPMVYGAHDQQMREDAVLRRIRAGRRQMPIGAGNLLWTRGHVDDIATGVLAAIDTRAADGMAVNLGEPTTVPIATWFQQVIDAAEADLELVTVPDSALPAELILTAAPAQHMLVSVHRAEELFAWSPTDSTVRVAESVRWHLINPPESSWTTADAQSDDEALSAA